MEIQSRFTKINSEI